MALFGPKKSPKTQRASPRSLVMEDCEPRILYSAEFLPFQPEPLSADADAYQGHQVTSAVHQASAQPLEQHTEYRHELVIVDAATPDRDRLVKDLLASLGSEDRDVEVLVLEAASDGIEQITGVLAQYRDLDAVHLISHGSDGEIQLGSTSLNFESLTGKLAKVQSWANAFGENADLMIYGCDLATTQDGQSLVTSLAKLTGADVAASIDAGNAEENTDYGTWNSGSNGLTGGSSLAERNVIAGNYAGISVDGAGGATSSNAIGTDQNGSNGPNEVVDARDVVLIDTQLQDSSVLIGAVNSGAMVFAYDGTSESATSILDRVAAWAQQSQTDIKTLSILSHGVAGGFELGNQWITTSTFDSTAANWKRLSGYFVQDADIYILGCDVGASGSDGQQLLDQLAFTTSTEVYASDDITGVNGDWTLEIASAGNATLEQAVLGQVFDVNGLQAADVSLAWYNASWGYRQLVTIDAAMVTGTSNLSNFAVLVSVTDANLKSTGNGGNVGQTDGGDFVFTSADGTTKLDYQIEGYNAATGTLLAWVEVPTLDYNDNTELFLYYGNAGVANQWNNSGTWDTSYKGVWHLGSDYNDSTSNAVNGTNIGSSNYSVAQIGAGDDFNGTSNYITTTSSAARTANSFTVSLWFNADASNFAHMLLWEGQSSGNGWGDAQQEMHISLGDIQSATNIDNQLSFFLGNSATSGDPLQISTAFTDTSGWHYVSVVVSNMSSSPTATMYVDGVSVGSDTGSTANTSRTSWDTAMQFGRPGAAQRYYDGGLDEIRLATTTRSADWIQTEYNNQNTPGTYVTVASEETYTPLANVVPGGQSINEDTSLIFSSGNGNQISVTDSSGTSLDVTLSITNGTLTLSSTAGLTFSAGDGTGDTTMTFSGSLQDINTGLNGLSFDPTADYAGGATLTIETSEGVSALDVDAALDGRYTFDNTGALGTDDSGNGNTGTIFGATAFNDPTRGDVLNFDGSNDYVQIAGLFGNPADVTLAAWVNLTSADSQGSHVISMGDSLTLAVDLSSGSWGVSGVGYTGSTWDILDSGQFIVGTGWHHLAFSYDDTNNVQTLYIDGVAVASASWTDSIAYNLGANTFLGAHGDGSTSYDFNGLIDDARVFTRALSASEVAELASSGSTATDTDNVAITVNAVNDAPSFTGLNGTPSFTEGSSAVVLDSNVTIFDTELSAANNFSGTTLTLTRNGGVNAQDVYSATGTLSTLNQGGNLVVGGTTVGTVTINGGGTLVLTFTSNATNALVNSVMQQIAYSNSSDDPPASVQIDWTFDDGNAGAQGSGGALTATGSTTVTITPVNDAPSLTATAGNPGFTEGGSAVTLYAGAAASTVESGQSLESLVLTVSNVTDGTDEILGADGSTFALTNGNSGTTAGNGYGYAVSLSGSTATVTFTTTGASTGAIESLVNGLSYSNSSDNPSTASRVVTLTSVQDSGGTDNGGADTSALAIASTVTMTAVNDAPVNTVPGTQTVAEEVTTAIAGISIADVDDLGANLTTQLQVTNGVLSVTVSGAAVISAGANGSGDLTILGNETDINATLASLTYTGNTDINGTAADTLTVTTNDQGNTGTGGAQQDVDTVQIDITAENDAPVNTVPGPQTVAEETTTAITGISIADVDDLGANLTTQLQVSNGVLNVTLSGAATISAGANGSGDLTILGNETDINATLATLTYTGSTNVNGTAADTLTVTTDDQGNTGSGGAQQDVDTVQIDITAVNDAPVNTVPGTQTAAEETTTAIAGISIADVDDLGANLTSQLQVTNGVLNVTLAGAAVISAGANGSDNLTILGNETDINATLATLTYTGNTDVNGTAADTLVVTTNDQGNTGSVGAQQDVDNVQIDITAVNDAPINTVPGTRTVAEETATAIAGISIADVDDLGANLTTQLQVTNGLLNVTLSGAATISAGANGSGDLTILGGKTDINATLASLTYTGNTDANGTAADTLTVTTNDQGNTGSGGAL